MRKQKAIIDFSKVKDNDLPEAAYLIYNKMTGNADFPTPPVLMPAYKSAIDEYSDALIKSKDGTKQDTAIKNAKREILLGMITENGNYVNLIANGDLVKLEGSGYPLTKVPEPIGILEKPVSFAVTDGDNPGIVNIEIALVSRATGYIVAFCLVPDDGVLPTDDAKWFTKLFSKTTGQIAELESGKKYAFKAAATSPEASKMDQYSFTEPIERFVQ